MNLRIDLRALRGEATFGGLVLLLFVVARFVGVAIHEVLGHGLAATALGGSFFAVYVSPALGFAAVDLDPASPMWAVMAVKVAGIVAEAAFGVFLLVAHGRVRGFLPRLFALLLLEVLLIHSFLYAGIGAFEATRGDTWPVVQAAGGDPPIGGIRFLLPSLALAALVAILISTEVLKLLQEHFPDVDGRGHLRGLLLFWFVPLGAGLVSGTLAAGLVEGTALIYLLVFTGAAALLFLMATLLTRPPLGIPERTRRVTVFELRTPAASLAAVVILWLSLFGPTPSTAHGAYLADPPPTAERDFIQEMAVNVDLHVAANGSAHVRMRLRGMWEPTSPLMTRAWTSFDSRPDWDYYVNTSRTLARQIFNVTRWDVLDFRLDGTAWVMGETLDNARTVLLTPDEDKLVEFYNFEDNVTTVFLFDPWLYTGLPGGFLDEVNISWESGLGNVTAAASGPGANPFRLEHNRMIWRSDTEEAAHPYYYIQYRTP